MTEKIYLHLLLICGVLCQGIIAALSDDDIQESSALLTREKRGVNLGSGINDANYVTIIKEYNRATCIGVILSHYTVITVATCVKYDKSRYKNFCGSRHAYLCATRNIASIVTNYDSHDPRNYVDGIALLTVDPPFTFGPKTGSIQLYKGPLRTDTQATIIVSGWGCYYTLIRRIGILQKLRKITIPIMNHGECQNVYRRNFRVSNNYICTYDRKKYCPHDDLGAPLVVNNMLAGIQIFNGKFPNQTKPDVFIDLQLTQYSQWIRQNVRLM